jgi:hypothetical protein
MPYNLLLLPLLGGYIFITQWNRTRFNVMRIDGHRLLFQAATAGAVFLLSALLISTLCRWWGIGLSLDFYWHSSVPFDHSGKAAIAFLLGALLWKPLNYFTDKRKGIERAIQNQENPLELMLQKAMTGAHLVLLTVKNGKVYVGFVSDNFNPALPNQYLKLLLTTSGYRDSDTKKVTFTNDYSAVYEQLLSSEAELDPLVIEGFEIVIPIAEIQSVSFFAPNIYRKYFNLTVEEIALTTEDLPSANTPKSKLKSS